MDEKRTEFVGDPGWRIDSEALAIESDSRTSREPLLLEHALANASGFITVASVPGTAQHLALAWVHWRTRPWLAAYWNGPARREVLLFSDLSQAMGWLYERSEQLHASDWNSATLTAACFIEGEGDLPS